MVLPLNQELEPQVSETDRNYTYTDVVKEWYYQIELTGLTVGDKIAVEDCYEVN